MYLSNHITSGNEIGDFTDLDLRELLCPLNINRQKATTTARSFYPMTVPAQQTSYNQTQQTNYNQTQQTNFLNKNYRKIYKAPVIRPAKKEN